MTASVKPPARLKKRPPTEPQLLQPKFLSGRKYEQQAAEHLQRSGYLVLDRNICWKNHELDIVAEDTQSGDLVFVEVKGRASTSFGPPAAAVSWRQLRSLSTVANRYRFAKRRQHQPFRFDIIAISAGTIHHYQNVTWL